VAIAFTVVLVGRPNVGKSTLFNRLVGKKLAIVDDTPGVTRDWKKGEGNLAGMPFTVLDTPGLEEASDASLEGRMRQQTHQAVREADVVWFIIDGRAGVTPMDEHFAEWLRCNASDKPVSVIVNKCENDTITSSAIAEAWNLGFGEPNAISAEHNLGTDCLFDLFPKEVRQQESGDEEEQENPYLQIAVIGRPNAGKSTLINALTGTSRLLTGAKAGLTRDAIAIETDWNGQPVRFVDTAGMRRKSRIEEKLEKLSIQETLHTIRFAHVCILVVDAVQGMDKQDLTIARLVEKEGRGLVVAYNKWDAVEQKADSIVSVQDRIARSMPQLPHTPVLPLSAQKLRPADKLALLNAVQELYEHWNTRVPTSKLNELLKDIQTHHPPPLVAGRRIKIRYMTQIKTRPPTFVLFLNKPEELPENYLRYISSRIRATFGLPAVPMRLYLRKGENPYAP
jgi:GTP-binding protein